MFSWPNEWSSLQGGGLNMSRIGKYSFVLSIVTLFILAIARSILKTWLPFFWILLGFVVLFVIVAAYFDRKFFADFFSMKTTKHGMSMGLVTVLVLAVLVLVNILGARKYKVWDFSISQSNTLSDQSIKLIKDLKEDLQVAFFYKQGDEKSEETRRQFRELIKKYQDQTDKMRLEFYEVNERPDMTEKYGVNKGSGVVFLEYKGRRNRVEKIDEQEITSALVKVTREKSKTIYVMAGHGEPSLDDTQDPNGQASLKSLLENNNYTVKTWQSNTDSKLPEDADVILISGAIHALQGFELDMLEAYLKKGGQLFLALESQKQTGLEKLIQKLGVNLDNNFILNVIETPFGRGINQAATVGSKFSSTSDITKVFKTQDVVVFRLPSSLSRDNKVPEGLAIDEIIKTPAAMAFTSLNFSGEGKVQEYSLGVNIKGKFPGTADAKEFSIVVFGDADFMSNEFLYKYMNRDLVLNTMASLAKEENLISITPKEPQITRLDVNETRSALLTWGFIIPLPLILLGTGITLWMRRRHA